MAQAILSFGKYGIQFPETVGSLFFDVAFHFDALIRMLQPKVNLSNHDGFEFLIVLSNIAKFYSVINHRDLP